MTRRTKIIGVRFTEDEYAELQKIAKACNLSLAELIRVNMERAAEADNPSKLREKVLMSLYQNKEVTGKLMELVDRALALSDSKEAIAL